ncbi:MAG: protein kinase [Myxococcales bacterium]|nr:protein kinase [Myxococcales bacterium]
MVETDATQPGMSGPHPTIAELRDQSHPNVSAHIETCPMCRSIIAADDDVPIALDLPKGLVSETAFRWPADAMARGGMAQIFLGEDKRLGRTVILKAPREGDDLPAGMAEMFQRRVSAEARILAKLQHPSIVTIYELGKASVGWPFCVLEKVDGTSLRDRLDELAEQEAADGTPRTRERLELLSNLVSIAEALAYAHERRVVHRDCTPNNILLGKRGEATLIDWGIARDLDAPAVGNDASIHDQPPSMSGRMVTISAGTPPYLPLEQSQGRKADPSFDVYSFGVTLYEVVAGKTPFEWKSADGPGARTAQIEAFMAWLSSEDHAPPAMPRDKELSGIIARAMAKEPGDRFTADELVRALKQYLTGDLVFSHRYSITGRLARWARNHKAASVTVLFLVASAVAGALVWAQLSRQAKEEADLRTIAAAARATASEKQNEADQAGREAEAAKLRAEEAERQGKSSQQLRIEADAKRKAADTKRKAAEEAATQAKGTADEAVKKFEEAMKVKDEAERQRDQANGNRDAARAAQLQAERERDAARASQNAAEKEREAARASRDAADRERDAAKQTALAAQADRDAARSAREAADRERDAARAAASAAEKEREAAISARAAIERERDEAKRKLAELEAKQREPSPPP